MSYPRSPAVFMASGAGGRPTYPSNVPAESTVKAAARPARRAMLRKTPSAIGERQMLEVQTKRMPMVMAQPHAVMLDNEDASANTADADLSLLGPAYATRPRPTSWSRPRVPYQRQ